MFSRRSFAALIASSVLEYVPSNAGQKSIAAAIFVPVTVRSFRAAFSKRSASTISPLICSQLNDASVDCLVCTTVGVAHAVRMEKHNKVAIFFMGSLSNLCRQFSRGFLRKENAISKQGRTVRDGEKLF